MFEDRLVDYSKHMQEIFRRTSSCTGKENIWDNRYRRFSVPLLHSTERPKKSFGSLKYELRNHKIPSSSWKWLFLLVLIAITMFLTVTSLDGTVMTLSKRIDESTAGMESFQRQIERLFRESKNKTTTEVTQQTTSFTIIPSITTSAEIESTTTKRETIATTTKQIIVCNEAFDVFPVTGDCHKYYMCLPTQTENIFHVEVSLDKI